MFGTGVPADPRSAAGGIDFKLFHTGCPVAPGSSKFTVQKFGERPPHVRVAETWPEDVATSTRQLFAAADADGSGALDAAELSRLHPAMEGLDVGERLRAEVDVDGSGAVELIEFAATGHHWKHARLLEP